MLRWLAGLVIVGVVASIGRSQGALQRAREAPPSLPSTAPAAPPAAIPSPQAAKSSDTGGRNDLWWVPNDGDALLGELYLAGLATLGAGAVATSPFYLPGLVVGDNFTSGGYFPAYPYAGDRPGYQIIDPHWGEKSADPADDTLDAMPRNWALRYSVEDGNDFRGLNRADVCLFLDMKTRLGLRTNWNFLEENLGNGRTDSTTLGDTEVTYRIAQSPWLQTFTGLGFRVRTDDVDTRWGFNFYYGGDFYPVKPVIVSSSLDIGSIGSQWVFHGRATVGVNYRHFELFTGYDFMRLGTVNLQGPLVGLRFWF